MMSSNETLSDTAVIEMILEGEKGLYEVIVRRYDGYLYKVGRSYGYNHQDTEDLMQDAFVDAYRNLRQFQHRSAFKTWLIRIMLNNCYRKRQKAATKNEFNQEINENATPMFPQSFISVHDVVHSREVRRIIEHALNAIALDYRMVFTLREVAGLSTAETAEVLGISESNVKVRLSRAKSMLRKELERSYEPEELFEFNLVYCDALVANVMRRINEEVL